MKSGYGVNHKTLVDGRVQVTPIKNLTWSLENLKRFLNNRVEEGCFVTAKNAASSTVNVSAGKIVQNGSYVNIAGGDLSLLVDSASITPGFTGEDGSKTLTSVTYTDNGYRYAIAPTITFADSTGGAVAPTATCTIDADGKINKITITAAGSGLTSGNFTYTISAASADNTTGVATTGRYALIYVPKGKTVAAVKIYNRLQQASIVTGDTPLAYVTTVPDAATTNISSDSTTYAINNDARANMTYKLRPR